MNLFDRMTRRVRPRSRKRTIPLEFERFEDRLLLATFLVKTTADNGNNTTPTADSLRAGILSGDDTINFAIPTTDPGYDAGTGTWTFSLASALPAIDHQVFINGTSQTGFAGTPLIVLDGGGHSFDGLILGAGSGNSKVQALDIRDLQGAGIHIQSANNAIVGNVILGAGASGDGVWVDNASGNTIGGTVSGAANTIGSAGDGILITGTSATANLVAGNLIGTNAAGGNLGNVLGVEIDSPNNTVGGTVAAAANIIGFGGTAGIFLKNASGAGNVVEGNLIGTDAGGADLGNAVGVMIGDGTGSGSNNTIGGTTIGAGNTIAFNTGDGVQVNQGTGNAIRANLIYSNGGEGINVAGTANDGIVAPTSLAYTSVPNRTTIDYTITGTAGQSYQLDFFADSGTKGPAAIYLGSQTITIPSASFAATAAFARPTALTSSQLVTATVTALDGSTSNFASGASFSDPYNVTTGADHGIGSFRQAILDTNAAGGSPTITFTLPSPFRIVPTSALPVISRGVVIDGTSLPGYAFGSVMVQLDGGTNHIGGDGLTLDLGSNGSTIEGLGITGYASGAAIHVKSLNDAIVSDFLGVTTAGANGANRTGIFVDDARGTTIGGTTGNGNVIGFNSTAGVQIIGTSTTDATNALVEGNRIGTDAAGTQDWGNGTAVQIFNASGNTIGGTTGGASTPAANVIAFSTTAGIQIGSGSGNAVNANTYLGTNGSLQTPSVAANDIGLGVGANGNIQPPGLLSASLSSDGKTLGLALTAPVTDATVLDVYLYGTGERTFLGEMTIVAGDSSGSLVVSGVTTNSRIVVTQTVAASGTSAFSAPLGAGPQTTVTNTLDAGPGSLRNALASATDGTTIRFAIPTTDPNYSASTGKFTIKLKTPITVAVALTVDGTSELTPQSTPAIVLNAGGGASSGLDLTADGTTIEGLAFSGFTGPAIIVASAQNTIGGTAAGQGNVISTANSAGVSIIGASNVVEGNWFGTDAAGANLGNAQGVIIQGAGRNTIGGTASGSGNTIGFSATVGVSISGSSASLNVLEGNFIGTNASGTNLGNKLGVVIDGASDNLVGGPGAGNTIAFNGSDASHGALTVNAGAGNAILENLFFGNTGTTIAASGIDLTNGGNHMLAAPVITGVTASGSGASTVTLDVTGMKAGTYTLDVFASAPGDTLVSGQVDARVHLATLSNITIVAGQTTLNESIPKSLSGGQQVTATWTVAAPAPSGLAAGDTSGFSVAVAVPQPFVVTTAAASGPGSLAAQIAAVNADSANPSPDTIVFQLSTSDPNYNSATHIWTIPLTNQSGPLPAITHPVILDASTQTGYSGTPVVVIDGGGLSGGVLTLKTGASSPGSTVRGLEIVHSGGAGIDVESNRNLIQANVIGAAGLPNGTGLLVNGTGNTIGGTATGAGNVIANNSGDGIDVTAPNTAVNTIRGNLIYGNTGTAIVTTSNESAPTLTAAISTGGKTTIEGSGPAGATFDFYATSGPLGPAAIFLGSSASFPASLSISVPAGALVTATSTSPTGDTSALSSPPLTVTNALSVTNTNDSGVGSLRQALAAANNNHGLATIIFSLPSGTTSTIKLLSPLPEIDNPIVLDATGLEATPGVPVLVIDGQGLSGDGLVFGTAGTGSAGSTIKGLDIVGFVGAGINLESGGNIVQGNFIGVDTQGNAAANSVGITISGSNNTIGGTAAGDGNTIAHNTGAAVDVTGGSGEAIRQNLIFGNGSAIVSAATSTIVPAIIAVSSVPNLTTIDYTVKGVNGQTYDIDFYASTAAGGPAGVFLGSTTVTLSGTSQNLSITLSLPTALGSTQAVTATETGTIGTSPFATTTAKPTSNPFTVTNTSDNVQGSFVGSLRQAILNANNQPPAAGQTDQITFAIASGTAPFVIAIAAASPLPTIAVPVSILGGTGAPTVEINGGGHAFDGLVLGPGSDGSVIQGLDIANFGGAGINLQSNGDLVEGNVVGIDVNGNRAGNSPGIAISGNNNTVGGTTTGASSPAANRIGNNSSAGIAILSGTGNSVHANTYEGTNGSLQTPSVAASDIALASNANGSVLPPQLLSATLSPDGKTLALALSGDLASTTVLDVYLYTDALRTFLGEATIAAGASSGSLSVSGVTAGTSRIVATQTVDPIGTSAFSAPLSVTATTVVTNTNDAGPGSLRDALSKSKAGDVIKFQIPGTGPFTIDLTSTLTVDVALTIDGTSEQTSLKTPAVVLSNGKGATSGLDLKVDGIKVEGLQFTKFTGPAIIVESAHNTIGGSTAGAGNVVSTSGSTGVAVTGASNLLEGNFIGTDSVGDNLGNSTGILIQGSADNTVGGTTSAAANIIGFNTAAGVSISGTSATGNLVEGNFIGTNAAANNLGNGVGIALSNDPGNTIGGSTFGTANVIGFNAGPGILITGSAGNRVLGNYIGTDPFNDKMGNGVGIEIDGSSNNSIGGTITGTVGGSIGGSLAPDRPFPAWVTEELTYSGTGSTITGIGNIIGFNQGAGISINGTAPSPGNDGSVSSGNVLLGNLIGLNLVYQRQSSSSPQVQGAGNLGDGIDLNGSGVTANLIGASEPLSYTPASSGTVTPVLTLADSYISATSQGAAPPVTSVILRTFPPLNVTGGLPVAGTAYLGNIVTANRGAGVSLANAASANVLVGNTIGSRSSTPGGAANLLAGNSGNGIAITNSPGNTVGDAALVSTHSITNLGGAANVVSGNSGDGILVSLGASVGAANVVAGNQVSFNTQNGIHFVGDLSAGSPQVQIVNNLVGTTFDGKSTVDANGIPQGNGLDGIRLDQSEKSAPVISGVPSAVAAYNVSSGNGLSGINVQGNVTFPADTTSYSSISYASVGILGNHLGTDISGGVVSAKSSGVTVPFGNALDGLLLNEVLGVTVGQTGQGNLISGNLGRGIEVRSDNLNLAGLGGTPGAPLQNVIQANLIGVGGAGLTVVDPNLTNLGNLSDGIYLRDPGILASGIPAIVLIQDNTVSNNHGAGIHAFADANISMGQDGLVIAGNKIGTDPLGTTVEVTDPTNPSLLDSLGNGSDGVFLDGISTTDTTAELVKIAANVISGNHADGIDLLKSSRVLITGNKIGVDALGISAVGDAKSDFGNASNGIFVNQSQDITIGSTTGDPGQIGDNIISGNHSSGVFVSGTNPATGGTASKNNRILGNWIGVGYNKSNQAVAIPNAVAGLILSNADSNTVGGGGSAFNVISGNALDGVLLVNEAQGNAILNNRIGTDPSATRAISNSADGVFLLGSTQISIKDVPQNTTPSTISGNTVASNIIAGNNQNGIQVFGTYALNNSLTGNFIGLTPQGTSIPNGADGVLVNSAGQTNTIGGTDPSARNIIAGNNQAGIVITGSPDAAPGNGTLVEGNFIGTDGTGTLAIKNGSSGILIYGSSANTIGGATNSPGTGAGNVISGNSQAGVQIFNPGGLTVKADNNLVLGNLIGTDATGSMPLPNGSEGVVILNGNNNTVGGTSSMGRNVISGNAGNGVVINQFRGLSAAGNQVQGNFIGTDAAGSAKAGLGNRGSGVVLTDGPANVIGGSGGAALFNTQVPSGGWSGNTPGNVISGNGQWGVVIQVTADSAGPQSTVEGNVIGMDASGMSAIGNGQGGISVVDISHSSRGQTIGGSVPGAGNLISGNANVGIQLAGGYGQTDVVQGNLIGLDAAGRVVRLAGGITGNKIGILVNSSLNDLIGGTSPAERNIISGNSQAGIQIVGANPTGDRVLGNFIGTNLAGDNFPGDSNEGAPAQDVGVLISGASNNTVGQIGAPNVISGNAIGVQIAGVKQNGAFLGTGNQVVGNRIGTDSSGTQPVSNLDLGVFVNNSSGNIIGPGNVISANGIAGIEILAEGSQSNVVTGNTIGTGKDGQVFLPPKGAKKSLSSNGPGPEAGIPVYERAQLNGVVILGASQNMIGMEKKGRGFTSNAIHGNVEVGVYITSRDFNGVRYSVPANNVVSGNLIRSNGLYGVLLYNAPRNLVRPYTTSGRRLIPNRFGAQRISFRNYQTGFDVGTTVSTRRHKTKVHTKSAHVVHTHKARAARVVMNGEHPHGATHLLHGARPRVQTVHGAKARR